MYEELKEFGLSENEIVIYVELLKAGTTTANRIAKLTGIKRSTTYEPPPPPRRQLFGGEAE